VMANRLVLLRHGESLGNKENRICGWTDVDLSKKGVVESRETGRLLKNRGFFFDVAYTSMLRRAIKTAWLVLDEMDLFWIPVVKPWRLNERHFGRLEGLERSEAAEKFLDGAAPEWRRRSDIPPPRLENDDPRHPINDLRYKRLELDQIPNGESRRDTLNRILPLWEEEIMPKMSSGREVLLVAHGDIIRTIVMHLNHLSDEELRRVGVIGNATAIVYELDDELRPIRLERLGYNLPPQTMDMFLQHV